MINTYGRCQPSSAPHSGRSALCLWMCTGPLIYSLPLQWSYLYCTVVSQCNSPNCAISQPVTCHVVNVSCVCHALCDRFAVCCVQGNMLLCQHVYMCIVLWSICHAFVMHHAIVPLCGVCKRPCCCINMYCMYLVYLVKVMNSLYHKLHVTCM